MTQTLTADIIKHYLSLSKALFYACDEVAVNTIFSSIPNSIIQQHTALYTTTLLQNLYLTAQYSKGIEISNGFKLENYIFTTQEQVAFYYYSGLCFFKVKDYETAYNNFCKGSHAIAVTGTNMGSLLYIDAAMLLVGSLVKQVNRDCRYPALSALGYPELGFVLSSFFRIEKRVKQGNTREMMQEIENVWKYLLKDEGTMDIAMTLYLKVFHSTRDMFSKCKLEEYKKFKTNVVIFTRD